MRTSQFDLSDLASLYPAQGQYGHKRNSMSAIFRHVQPDAESFADPFGGTGSVSWAAKIRGLSVFTNDIMAFSSTRLSAQIENDGVVLTEQDCDLLEMPNPDKQAWCEKWYGQALGLETAQFLDLITSSLSRLDSPAKRNVTVYAAVLCVMRRMNYCSVSFNHHKTFTGKRKLDGFSLRKAFRQFALQEYPFLVFSNGKQHRVTRRDALDLIAEIIADILYVDAPFCSPAGQYNSDLGFYDKLVSILQGHPALVSNPYSRKALQPPHTDFSKREDALLGFARLFIRAQGCRRIIFSYNLTSKIAPIELISLAEQYYGKLVSWEEYDCRDRVTRDGLTRAAEVLLVFDRHDRFSGGVPSDDVRLLNNNFRFIDLFAGGMGAFHLAGRRNGGECVFASEIDEAACLNYTANHGLTPAGDITQVNPANIPEHEILCGGFPCVSWSRAGHDHGFIDERGKLFFEITRIAKAKRPLVLFLENVDELASEHNRNALRAIRNEIESAGYDVYYAVLNSSFYGTSSSRRRIYFVCFRKDLGVHFDFPQPTCELTSITDCLLTDEETEKYRLSADEMATVQLVPQKPKPCQLVSHHTCPHGAEAHCPLRPVRIGKIRNGSLGDRIYDAFHAPTIVSCFDSDIILANGRLRRMAPREMASSMGFPKDFILPTNERLAKRFIGNSMAVPVVEVVFKQIVETLKSRTSIAFSKAA